MIKCEWIYCKFNKMTGICACNDTISLRCATIDDLISEDIIETETELSKENSSNVLICNNYVTMD